MTLTERIKQKAVELGFDLVGMAPARIPDSAVHYARWIEQGYQGEMGWLENVERRSNPAQVLEGARSVVALGLSYYMADPPAELWNDPSRGRIARYAWGPDYHDEITPRLKNLSAFICEEGGPGTTARYYVDTGPVLERAFAAEAGLGFIGKNTTLITPGFGSYVFLAEVLVNRELDYNQPESSSPQEIAFTDEHGNAKQGSCGSCRRCLDICPTNAFPAAHVLDSNRCISYLTIELKGAIPEALRPKLGNWIYGCDECQSVCPWVHRYSRPNDRPFLKADPRLMAPSLLELMALGDEGFRKWFRGTPMKRTKRRGLLRNVAVALGNWGHPEARPILEQAMQDKEPLVREHAGWALRRVRR